MTRDETARVFQCIFSVSSSALEDGSESFVLGCGESLHYDGITEGCIDSSQDGAITSVCMCSDDYCNGGALEESVITCWSCEDGPDDPNSDCSTGSLPLENHTCDLNGNLDICTRIKISEKNKKNHLSGCMQVYQLTLILYFH